MRVASETSRTTYASKGESNMGFLKARYARPNPPLPSLALQGCPPPPTFLGPPQEVCRRPRARGLGCDRHRGNDQVTARWCNFLATVAGTAYSSCRRSGRAIRDEHDAGQNQTDGFHHQVSGRVTCVAVDIERGNQVTQRVCGKDEYQKANGRDHALPENQDTQHDKS